MIYIEIGVHPPRHHEVEHRASAPSIPLPLSFCPLYLMGCWLPCGLGSLPLNQSAFESLVHLRLPCLPRDFTSAFLVPSPDLAIFDCNFYYNNQPTTNQQPIQFPPFNHRNHGRSWNQQEGGCQTRVQDLYGDHCVNSPTYPTAYCSPLRVSCLPVLTIQTARLPVCTLNLTFSTPPQFMNTNIYLLSSRVYATEGYGFLLVKFVCVCFPSY